MSSAEPSSVYAGAAVDLTTAENGAVINANLAHHPFMKNEPRLVEVRDRVWSITGYSLANCSFVETEEGVVVFDTGNNVGQGQFFLSQIRSVTDKPIVAIIYSHSHYVNGASALVEDLNHPPTVIGHPALTKDAGDFGLADARFRRSNLQFGAYLPKHGSDARATTPEPEFEEPALRRAGFLPITRPIEDGETLEFGGLSFTFLWTVADTRNSISVWIPQLQTVLTNSVAVMYYPLYTLRGEVYRDPREIIASYDRLRVLSPNHYVPVHGNPISGAAEVVEILTLHRDAYAYTYHQAVRAINLGWTPDQLVARIHLPQRFLDEPTLYEVYSEFPYALRGIYRGLMGWFDEDTAELNPPTPQELGKAVVDGFGGMNAVVEASRKALAAKRYDLAASLAKFAVDADSEHRSARQAKANALRMLAHVSKSLQSHNFYLTEALDLEGKLNRFEPPSTPVFPPTSVRALSRLPAQQLVRQLESRINPERSSGVHRGYAIRFDDTGDTYPLQIRDGVAEVGGNPAGTTIEVRATRSLWASFLLSDHADVGDLCTEESELCELFWYFRT